MIALRAREGQATNPGVVSNRRGIVAFLAITFAITYGIEGAMLLAGFRISLAAPGAGQYVIAAVMWVPAVAAMLTLRFVTREGPARLGFRFGPWKPYLTSALLIPLGFAVIYALTWLLRLGRPDWQLRDFFALLSSAGADLSNAPSPRLILPIVFLASVLVAPFFNSLFGLGEEIGWRGFLLPRLLPLGKARAYLLLGLIWGLWHAPLILVGFNYPGHPFLGIVGMVGLTTTFGIFVNEMRLRHNSVLLAGWIHGVFNCQAYGIWRLLFPHADPLLGGFGGLVGIAVWFVLGLWQTRRALRVSRFL